MAYSKMMAMLKFFSPTFLSVGLFGVSLVTIGSIISIVAGLMSIIYTTLKIYKWFKDKNK